MEDMTNREHLEHKGAIRKVGVILLSTSFLILWFHQLADQVLNAKLSHLMQKESYSLALVAFGLFLNGLLIFWILPIIYLVGLQRFHPKTLNVPLLTKISDYTREWLRGIGVASLWMFVLLLPGLFRWADYLFLPFVCFFDPEYQKGCVDALKKSRIVARGSRIKVWSLWVGFGFLLPLLISGMFGDYESLREHPILGSLLVFIEALLQTTTFYLLWRIYSQSIENTRPSS